ALSSPGVVATAPGDARPGSAGSAVNPDSEADLSGPVDPEFLKRHEHWNPFYGWSLSDNMAEAMRLSENQEVALRKWFDRVQELAGRIQGDYTYVVDSPKASGRQIVLLLAAPKGWEKYRADLMQELYAAVGAEAGDY